MRPPYGRPLVIRVANLEPEGKRRKVEIDNLNRFNDAIRTGGHRVERVPRYQARPSK